jgi:ribosomal protein S18 acetylase RimI-like enzyme
MDLTTLEDQTRIIHVDTLDLVETWRDGFAQAYPAVFTGAPYFEKISRKDALLVWDTLTETPEHITLVAANPAGEVLGFGIAIPLLRQRDVAIALTGLIPVPHTFYLAELGVCPEARGRGLGRTLVHRRMALINKELYTGAVLRVAEGRNTSRLMYEEMGFEDMGVDMAVKVTRVDGESRTDRRLFLHCVLSQMETGDHFEEDSSR